MTGQLPTPTGIPKGAPTESLNGSTSATGVGPGVAQVVPDSPGHYPGGLPPARPKC